MQTCEIVMDICCIGVSFTGRNLPQFFRGKPKVYSGAYGVFLQDITLTCAKEDKGNCGYLWHLG